MSEIVRIRASSWGTLFDCAYKWEAENILGMTKPSSGRAHLGTSMHKSTAAIDTRQMNNDPMSIDEAIDIFLDSIENPDEEVDWKHDDLAITDARHIGIKLNDMYLNEWSHKFNFLSVEKEIGAIDINTDQGVIIRLTGRMDRIRIISTNEGTRKSIVDVKTGKAAVSGGKATTKGKGAQLGVYEILEEEESGEACNGPAGIIGMQTSKNPKIALGSIDQPRKLLLGDDQNEGMISMAGKMLKSGLFTPNPSSMLCDKKWCARWNSCIYHG